MCMHVAMFICVCMATLNTWDWTHTLALLQTPTRTHTNRELRLSICKSILTFAELWQSSSTVNHLISVLCVCVSLCVFVCV